ncbi:MAG: ferredoxin-NADP reductase [Omnitrophica bacterium RBG_13_46_9]|nr:MAG: ferredoxin-NADP reductase [Omnitrophica bacterium RBG_13_46_9]
MKITKKVILASTEDTKVIRIEVYAPAIAKKAKAGQFVVLMVKGEGERIPLTIVEKDEASGTITLIFQELGFTTRLLGKLERDSFLYALTGPLGHPTDIKKYGGVILIGGGVGIAEIYPVAKALKEAENYVITVIGARTKELLILENELKTVSDELHIATDDGSSGKKGFTTEVLKEILDRGTRDMGYGLIYAVGPIPMMKKVSAISKGFSINTVVSLNALMVDATGMCGCCRVTIENEVKFSCIDGPEFDGHKVDWEELEKRSKIYEKQERHICKLNENTT